MTLLLARPPAVRHGSVKALELRDGEYGQEADLGKESAACDAA